MYRYFLFFYYDFYPHGGMEDCVLKTNNYDDLIPFIDENYSENWYQGTIAYYDAVEDTYWEANMKPSDDKLGVDGPYQFFYWEENTK